MMNEKWLIFVYLLMRICCFGQEKDEIVQCHPIEINQQDLERMNMEEQEKYVKSILDEYDRNLTTMAYLTSSAEFETHLNLNNSEQKRKTENLYEVYRTCLKTIAFVGRQFRFLINNNQSSMRWLLLRTQSIGDAGETDTAIKAEVHKLKTRIKEVYHRKFIWNNTRYGLDEVQETLGLLKTPSDLRLLWNAIYEVPIPMREDYITLIAIQNQQARQNRTSAVTHCHI